MRHMLLLICLASNEKIEKAFSPAENVQPPHHLLECKCAFDSLLENYNTEKEYGKIFSNDLSDVKYKRKFKVINNYKDTLQYL